MTELQIKIANIIDDYLIEDKQMKRLLCTKEQLAIQIASQLEPPVMLQRAEETKKCLNEFDDFNNEENIIEPFTDNYYKLKKWLTTIGGQFDAPEWINIKTQANGGQITRPNIKDFFPDKTLQEMMLIYKNNESLFNYIKKLDAYIDELESRLSV